MKLAAFEIEQNNKKFFLTYMDAEDLTDEEKVHADIWSKDNLEGYQRKLEKHRARLFAKYIKNEDNISPPAILLSVRESVNFKTKDGNWGTLEIPDEAVLYEVDGQHRVGGLRELLRKNELKQKLNFPVIIICIPQLGKKPASNPRYTEAKQFVVINRTQKTVRADLADRFKQRLTKEQMAELDVLGSIEQLERTQRALDITDELMTKTTSFWENKIKLPTGGRGIINQKAFTNSLEIILKEKIYADLSNEELCEAIDEYWAAWGKLCPLAFTETENYVIQRTTGAYVLHKLFIEVANLLRVLGKDWKKDEFYEVLNNMSEGVGDEFWHKDGRAGQTGTGIKNMNALAKRLRDTFLADNWQK